MIEDTNEIETVGGGCDIKLFPRKMDGSSLFGDDRIVWNMQ